MFEAQMDQSDLWKRVLEALRELVTEANLECSPSGIQMQAMDAAHVSLVCMLLRAEGFKTYNCGRNVNLGINLTNMSKILKCANKEDSITLRYEGNDSIIFLVESQGLEKVSEFSMKLMEIEGESLGIPEQQYKAIVSLPSAEFTKLCRDMQVFGESVQISVTSEGLRFSCRGEFGGGSTIVKPTLSADSPSRASMKSETDGGSTNPPVKREDMSQAANHMDSASGSRATIVEVHEDVMLNFSLKNLVQFTKAGALSDRVKLCLAHDVPLAVEYKIGTFGYMRFYLAPKVNDDDVDNG